MKQSYLSLARYVSVATLLIVTASCGLQSRVRHGEVDPGSFAHGGRVIPYDAKVRTFGHAKYYYRGHLVVYLSLRRTAIISHNINLELP